MNYFAHGCRFLDRPYWLAGTAVPDWLSVVDRKIRARRKAALPFVEAVDPRVAAVAGGIVQHHLDDQWFHSSRAFAELSLEFTVRLRDVLDQDAGFRPSFLGHILVELLLDAVLIQDDPSRLDAYYRAVAEVDSRFVAETVGAISGRPAPRLAWFIGRFVAERFLEDYHDDRRLLRRLNQVMTRVRLPLLPPTLLEILPDARRDVVRRRHELLSGWRPR